MKASEEEKDHDFSPPRSRTSFSRCSDKHAAKHVPITCAPPAEPLNGRANSADLPGQKSTTLSVWNRENHTAMSLSDRESEKGDANGLLSEDLVQSPTHKAASTKAVDFDGLLTPPLLLHEDLTSGNGGQAWPAGMILGKYLLRRKRDELQDSSTMLVLKFLRSHLQMHLQAAD